MSKITNDALTRSDSGRARGQKLNPIPAHPCEHSTIPTPSLQINHSVDVATEHHVLMSKTRRKQKEGFGPSPIQDYKVCSPCMYNKPSVE